MVWLGAVERVLSSAQMRKHNKHPNSRQTNSVITASYCIITVYVNIVISVTHLFIYFGSRTESRKEMFKNQIHKLLTHFTFYITLNEMEQIQSVCVCVYTRNGLVNTVAFESNRSVRQNQRLLFIIIAVDICNATSFDICFGFYYFSQNVITDFIMIHCDSQSLNICHPFFEVVIKKHYYYYYIDAYQ